jgi:HD-GYP domain-containing protein (c-di-GMP phosphodiesterase class II)
VLTALDSLDAKDGGAESGVLKGAVEALAMLVDARDHYTGAHTDEVANLSIRIALTLGLDSSDAHEIGLAGKLHDIGKVAVPDAMLRKPTGLTPEEWAVMRRHPIVGAGVVRRIPTLGLLAPAIRGHHEHWDGSGYPDGLCGTEIPLAARIVAVADAYGAITTERPYRAASSPEWALAEIRRCAGTQFDPRVVAALERLLEAAPTAAGAADA